jgi:hypothetical protein
MEREGMPPAQTTTEAVAQWMIANGYATGHGDTVEDLLRELTWQIGERISAEREACAKIADDAAAGWDGKHGRSVAYGIRDAIRARSA